MGRVCRYYSRAELPEDFLTGQRLAQANNYRLFCESIDIANFYRPWAADKCAFEDGRDCQDVRLVTCEASIQTVRIVLRWPTCAFTSLTFSICSRVNRNA